MAEFEYCPPYVYYSVSELSMVKDVRVMKSTKVKTIGYICNKSEPFLKDSLDSSTSVLLNLRHINEDVLEIYPYIIFGFLCTINGIPIVTVQSVKRFDSNISDMTTYQKQCLSLRSRLQHFDDVISLAKNNNWL